MLHEFAHVLGFGNLWNGAGIDDLRDEANDVYIGANGLDAWQNTIGCTTGQLPVDPASGHWSEDCLVSEVMTPSADPGEEEILSIITLRSMQDLGYQVDLSQADEYTICNVAETCTEFCPERADAACTRRRLDSTNNLRATSTVKAKLSDKGEATILEMAVDHFRKEDAHQLEQQQEGGETTRPTSTTFSVIYKENNRFFSRFHHRLHVEHLL